MDNAGRTGLTRGKTPVSRRSVYEIHHYCPHTFNAGDHFVIRSIREHLARNLPGAVFLPRACARNRGWGKPIGLRGPNVGYSNRHADAVIVGGSDLYNDWGLRIGTRDIERLKPPLFLIGLGMSSAGIGMPPRLSKARHAREIRAVNGAAQISSVRDHATQRFLQGLGVANAEVTGCPALYLFNRPMGRVDGEYAALTFPFPVLRARNAGLYGQMIDTLAACAAWCRRKGIRPLVVCHDDRDVHPARNALPQEEIFYSNYVHDYYAFFEKAAFVAGTRLHATILCGGMGKPFVNINLDARGEGFSETFGLGEWNVNAGGGDIRQEVLDRLDALVRNGADLFRPFIDRRDFYRGVFCACMQRVAACIMRTAPSPPPAPARYPDASAPEHGAPQ